MPTNPSECPQFRTALATVGKDTQCEARCEVLSVFQVFDELKDNQHLALYVAPEHPGARLWRIRPREMLDHPLLQELAKLLFGLLCHLLGTLFVCHSLAPETIRGELDSSFGLGDFQVAVAAPRGRGTSLTLLHRHLLLHPPSGSTPL